MLGLIATLVFATAGCASAAVIGSSLRQALPTVRRLAAERRTLAEDRVYLFTLIETQRHDGTPAPMVATGHGAASSAAQVVINPARRRTSGGPVRLRAAA